MRTKDVSEQPKNLFSMASDLLISYSGLKTDHKAVPVNLESSTDSRHNLRNPNRMFGAGGCATYPFAASFRAPLSGFPESEHIPMPTLSGDEHLHGRTLAQHWAQER